MKKEEKPKGRLIVIIGMGGTQFIGRVGPNVVPVVGEAVELKDCWQIYAPIIPMNVNGQMVIAQDLRVLPIHTNFRAGATISLVPFGWYYPDLMGVAGDFQEMIDFVANEKKEQDFEKATGIKTSGPSVIPVKGILKH